MSLMDSLISGVDMIAKSNKQIDTPLTIEGEILSLIDAGTGEYKIKYLGNTMTVFSASPNVVYNKGDVVCILVPNGDFSNRNKTILRTATPSAAPYTSVADKKDYFILSSDLLNADSDISLCTYRTELEKPINVGALNFYELVSNYLSKGHRTFCFRVKVKTDIKDVRQRVGGNYGLTLSIPTIENGDASARTYTFDINNMLGEVYNFEKWATQELYFTLPNTVELDENRRPSLFAFVKDFVQSGDPTIPDDIFFKEFGLYLAEQVPAEAKDGYYLQLYATEGTAFLENTTESKKTITPVLYASGNETSIEGKDCYWFIEDSSVVLGSADYSAKGGTGWKILNKKTKEVTSDDGSVSCTYKLDDYTLEVDKSDVFNSARYKCVVEYDRTLVSNIITIDNLNSPVKIELVSKSGSNNFIEGVGDANVICQVKYNTEKASDTSLTYKWTLQHSSGYVDNNFFKILRVNDNIKGTEDYFETEIQFPVSSISQNDQLICTVYENKIVNNILKTTLIGNAKMLLNTSTGINYLISMSNSNVIYKYDADGDSPMVADYDGPAAGIKSIAPFNFVIHKLDGTELSEVEYRYCKAKWSIPKNSMMKFSDSVLNPSLPYVITGEDDDYYYLEGYGRINIEYDILTKFNAKKTNNTVLLDIDFDGNILHTTATATFLKDGMSGTNGTKFAAVITYNDIPYGGKDPSGAEMKLRAAFAADTNKWYIYDNILKQYKTFDEYPDLNVIVYRDGEPTIDFTNPKWSILDADVNYSGINPFFKFDEAGHLFPCREWDDPNESSSNIIKLTLRVGDGATSISGNGEDLYVYYPIEITRVEKSDYLLEGAIAPIITGGFDSVLYATDGTNPKYDNNEPFVCEDSLYSKDAENLYDYAWEVSTNLIKKKKEEGEPKNLQWVSPVTIFDNGDTNNYLRVTMKLGAESIQPVQKLLKDAQKEYYNELYNSEVDVSNKDVLNQLGQFYHYYSWQQQLAQETIQTFLQNKLSFKTSVDFALNDLNRLKEYVSTHEHLEEEKYGNLQVVIANLEKLIETILTAIFKIGYTQGDVVVPKLSKISLSEQDEINIEEDFGLSVLEYIQLFVSDYNAAADRFNAQTAPTGYTELFNLYSEYQSFVNKFVELGLNGLPQEMAEMPAATQTRLGERYLYIGDFQDGAYPLYPGYCYECAEMEDEGVVTYYWKISYIDKNIYTLYNQLLILQNTFINVQANLISFDGVNTIFNQINELLSPSYFDNLEDYAIVSSAYEQAFVDRQADKNEKLKESFKIYQSYQNALKIAMQSTPIIHIKPILLSYNRYELSNINGWDGHKLYTGDNDEFLLAPQVGAGKKNENNQFTGMVMGIRKQSDTTDVGLFGYSNGAQSLFLDAMTGKSTFGVSGKSQIVIDPTSNVAKLYSGDFYDDRGQETGEGMVIDLTTPEIRWGNGNFWVDHDGILHAGGSGDKGAGEMAGWTIRNYEFASGNDKAFLNSIGYGWRDTPQSGMLATYCKANYKRDPETGKLILDESGNPILINAGWANVWVKDELDIDGNIITPAHWGRTDKRWVEEAIIDGELVPAHWETVKDYDPKNKIYLGPDGISVHTHFRVDNTGKLEVGKLSSSKHWTINAVEKGKDGQDSDDDRAYIAYNTDVKLEVENARTINKQSVYLGTDGLSIGRKFRVDADGSLEVGQIDQAHWKINSNNTGSYIYYGDNKPSNEITVDNLKANRQGGDKDVYLGTDGVVIGSMMTITTRKGSANKVTIGDMGRGGKYWTVGSKNGHTYFAYDTTGSESAFSLNPPSNINIGPESIYIGTDGVRIGTAFKAASRGDGRQSFQITLGAIRERNGRERCFKIGTTDTGAGVESWIYSNRGKSFSGKDTMITQFCAWIPNSPNKHDLLISTDGIRIGQKFCYLYNQTINQYQGYIMDDVLVGHKEANGTITWTPLSEYGGGGGGGMLPPVENYYF